jgi:hypothetical protein
MCATGRWYRTDRSRCGRSGGCAGSRTVTAMPNPDSAEFDNVHYVN